MGFFDKKKKKEMTAEDVFKQYGAETNDVKTPQKQTRKQAKKMAEEMRVAEIKKDQLLEKLSGLRKRVLMSNDSAVASYQDRVQDLYEKLRRAEDNHDKEAMAVVDNFILRAISDGANYCNRNSWVGLSACLDVLEDLISDRFRCDAWYKDAQYCKCRLAKDNLYVQNKDMEAKIKTINERGAKLREKYMDPRFKTEQASIAKEMVSLKTEREMYEKRIQENTQKIALAQKMMNEIERNVANLAEEKNFDFETEFDDVVEKQMENDMKATSIGKMNERMDTSRIKYTDSSLSISADYAEEESAPAFDIESMGF